MCIDSEIVQCCMCKDPEFNQYHLEDVETIKTREGPWHFCEQHQLALHNEGVKGKSSLRRFVLMHKKLQFMSSYNLANFEDLTMENIRILTQTYKLIYAEG